MRFGKLAAAVVFASSLVGAAYGADAPTVPATITIQADQPGHAISKTLWGIFFEDINLSADGGIYPELVRNRSFEDSQKVEHWSLVQRGTGKAEISTSTDNPPKVDPAKPFNKRVLQLKATAADAQNPVGISNDGYFGMAVRQGDAYDLSFWARSSDGGPAEVVATLESRDGKVYAKQTIAGVTAQWQRVKTTLKADSTDPKARLVLTVNKPGTLSLDVVSLMPQKTWKNHGLRPDLSEMLLGLKPGFVRFPGGCWVEGDTMRDAYRWKDTIGDIGDRATVWNIWQYWATNGLGFHEYMQMCEDLNAEPLYVINVGMSHKENVPMDKMDAMVQDAMDVLEYCNGPADSKWGAIRAKNGHPAPFNLKYMEIGNENGGKPYQERYPLFVKAIKAKYPNVTLVADDWGGIPKDAPVEVVDEHYYSTPEFFIQNAGKYDKYDRKGHKVYVGEYAVTQNGGKGNLRAAVGEAAFMTGMERNSDVVIMASYAPLFVHMDHRRWNPDLINFDSSRVYGIPSYYVQKMFSQNSGDVVLPTTVAVAEIPGQPIAGKVGVGTWLTQAEYKDIKVTQGDKVLYSADLAQGMQGMTLLGGGDWKVADGVLRQSSGKDNVRAVFGDATWHDYTYTLKARKTGGAEGFLILFGVGDADAKSWWNIGGWGNKDHALEISGVGGDRVSGSIETGKWYDIKIELKGRNIKCYLDGKLIHEATGGVMKPIYACSSLDKASGDVIVKVVNTAASAIETEIKIAGVTKLASQAKAEILSSENATDENSLENPIKVVPVSKTIQTTGNAIKYSFPGNSVTVIRAKAE